MSDHPVGAALAGVLFFALGAALAGGLWHSASVRQVQRSGWRHADGRLAGVLHRSGARGDRLLPLIAFTTDSGDRFTFTAADASYARAAPGTPVPVLYDPLDPQHAVVAGARVSLRDALAWTTAVALISLGAYVAWYARRRWATSRDGGVAPS